MEVKDDAISRQAAMKAAENVAYVYDENESAAGWLAMLINSLEILPSVQPETHDKRTETHACDCIDRRDALKLFTYNTKGERIPDYDCDNFPTTIDIKTVREMLKGLPPVSPVRPTCEDAISRQAAIDAMTNAIWHYPNELYKGMNQYETARRLAEMGLLSLPSAEPEPHGGEQE